MERAVTERAVLVPVKAFHHAKLRLVKVLPPAERAALARELATGVIEAAAPLPVSVVCDDHEVAAFAETLGAQVIWTPGLGLSGAVSAGVSRLAESGVDLVVVAHSDLPQPRHVREIGTAGTVTLVPDRRRDGTNVIALDPSAGFTFSYGPGSFRRHRLEAARRGATVVVLEDDELAADIDVPDDLAALLSR
ncbi:MAG: 2-phospho-L-lactate guanylyltransferase [Acidimicrobiales bacterium]